MHTTIARAVALAGTLVFAAVGVNGCSSSDSKQVITPGVIRLADTAGGFTAVPTSGTVASIVVPSSLTPGGFNATQLASKTYLDAGLRNPEAMALWQAIHYVQEGIFKMTGKTLPVVSSTNLTSGIVLTTMAAASSDITSLVGNSLALNGTENDAAQEAYYVSTFAGRTLVVANTYDGLVHGAVELLLGDHAASGFQIGYEILGMGPDWTNVPDYRTSALVFSESYVGRPGFLTRDLWVTSGQERGQGTIFTESPLAAPTDDHPPDESVSDSYNRWRVGTNMTGSSTLAFPGHRMQSYHQPVIIKLVSQYTGGGAPQEVHGFLAPTFVGPHGALAATPSNQGTIWIETNNPTAPSVFINQNSVWVPQSLLGIGAKLDVSAQLVRDVVLTGVDVPGYSFAGMLATAKTYFASSPNGYYVLGTDMEDGGLSDEQFDAYCSDKNWWPAYRGTEQLALGAYKLAGTQYAPVTTPVQTQETWWYTVGDLKNGQTDTIFAFNAWLLHEYDRYVDSRSNGNDTVVNGVVTNEGKNTATGVSKKAHIRTSFQSYGAHDVPPLFNPDMRTRVSIAAYPSHRGAGKWVNVKTGLDVAAALAIMLPNQISAAYTIQSSPYQYASAGSIGASHTAAYDQAYIKAYYDSGVRVLSGETNFEFGKRGLDYYMLAKMLWEPTMPAASLETIRTRWLQRAFGPGAAAMKNYYDFLAPETMPFNGPSFWATAMSYIDQAEAAINNPTSPYQQRLDDVKQYWYFYYLMAVTSAPASSSPQFREFVWKGQMSYQTSMYMVTHFVWSNHTAEADATPTYAGNSGGAPYLRAHYTHAETQAWWALVKAHWPVTHPHLFKDLVMANGQLGSTVDVNDLTPIVQFQPGASGPVGYLPTSPLPGINSVLTVARNAGDTIGYQVFWSDPTQTTATTNYGVSFYDPAVGWKSLVDFPAGAQDSVGALWQRNSGPLPVEVARTRLVAPFAGTYRFDLQPNASADYVVSLDYDLTQAASPRPYPQFTEPFTYNAPIDTYYTGAKIFYIPKKAQYLDFEIPEYAQSLNYLFSFNTGLPGSGAATTRSVLVTPGSNGWKIGYNSIPLNLNEQGSLGAVYCLGGSSQYQKTPYLYSVPMLYAFNERQLALPRALAAADGLAPLTNQRLFSDLVMANGQLGSTVDMNNVTGIAQFQTTGSSNYNLFAAMPPVVRVDTVAKAAGDVIGFQMFWSDPAQTPTTAYYGLSSYVPPTSTSPSSWQSIFNFPTANQVSVPATENRGGGVTAPDSLVRVTYTAPAAGVYRFDIQPAGWGPSIVSLDFDLAHSATPQQYPAFTHTFSENTPVDVWYGGPHFFYIPKNTQVLDFEIPNYSTNLKYVFSFYTGLPSTGLTFTRSITVTPGSGGWQFGRNAITLNANEAGTIAAVGCTGGASQYQKMPYLDSVPMRYAYNIQQLALPRSLATADGLTSQ